MRCSQGDPHRHPSLAALDEGIQSIRLVRMSPRSPEFQCAPVAIQAASESVLSRALAGSGIDLLISHRRTLDPCAFWQSFAIHASHSSP